MALKNGRIKDTGGGKMLAVKLDNYMMVKCENCARITSDIFFAFNPHLIDRLDGGGGKCEDVCNIISHLNFNVQMTNNVIQCKL